MYGKLRYRSRVRQERKSQDKQSKRRQTVLPHHYGVHDIHIHIHPLVIACSHSRATNRE
ncbi:uncharacterized protein BO95DRAFT_440690 [Aspergillus brunneoviolaceus CBS 621.78]|uniref:Uncharacterized protein n=1 Tax=Aspergillus brunneoviolaceus CBS 621.78 TaxID=1450534 RepID=A0ACD1GFJ9_9EURO|nr:hypothetical protein BO95DRAFT_440690 [Aspergillus brunneoviolaceus CBS 621.78]RAH48005.1 hypothetical protein BO95DRAFT_440690 [Aspergillus brunneoviolaceus CBS 621.78]